MTLFDPADFPSPNDAKTERRKRTKRAEPLRIVSDGRWHVVSTREGVIPYCHRIDPWRTPQQGSSWMRCERVGRIVATPERGIEVYPCPDCMRLSK